MSLRLTDVPGGAAFECRRLLCCIALLLIPAAAAAQQPTTQEARRAFQSQELTTANSFNFIFNPGQPPRIIWRDAEEARRLGVTGTLRVRWFDSDLNEIAKPSHPGRWGAYIEGTAPNGTPFRRAMTFYCRPPGFFVYPAPGLPDPLPFQPGPIPAAVWQEHQAEIHRMFGEAFFRSFNDSEAGATLIAGLSEIQPLQHEARDVDSAWVRNDDFHLALKLKVLGLGKKVRPLLPPRKRAAGPAPILHEGTSQQAEVSEDAKSRIDSLCSAWAKDSGEGFVTLVARHGIIVTHEAFGQDPTGKPITLDYRCDVASITKSATAILFSQFVDQGLISLDDSVATLFPDYPHDAAHVPTFRQCVTHMSGLSGHGDFGGCRNPQLENILLNGIDANQAGKTYNYSGMGFDLTAKAMEIVTGKSWRHLYEDHLFGPLGLGDVPMSNASAGAQFTARQLATLAQWFANGGSYGDLEFISPATFATLLPEPLGRRYPGVQEVEGIGNHWMKQPMPGGKEQLILSPRTIGHGSLTSCMFLIDLDRDLIIVQVRKQAGPRFGEWSTRFLETIADVTTGSAS